MSDSDAPSAGQNTSTAATQTPAATAAPWGSWATAGLGFGVFVAFLVLQTLAAIPFVVVMGLEDRAAAEALETNPEYLATAMLASGIGGTLLVALFAALRKRMTVGDYLAMRWPGTRPLVVWLLVAAAVVVAFDVMTALLGRELAGEWWMEVYANVKAPLVLGFATVIAAPLFEEVFFRGFLFAGWSRGRLGVIGTVVLTAALWAAMHVQYGAYEIGQIFVLGLLLGVARHRTGSLVVPLLIHVAINLTANIQVAYLT